ncbi:hypothetical protein [Pandoraea sp. PE-S2T-3]|uniref:hypothetical protein n=1 Tax=Pandoraea sp. PE-S2T-3 TaxID=1986993 RepID=UPI000B403F15|nr:hypothetical protein [Pandoraea sp. PE-S2T-3]
MEKSAKLEGSQVGEERESSANGAPFKRETLTLKKLNDAQGRDHPLEHSVTHAIPDIDASDKVDTSAGSEETPEFGEIWESEGGNVHRVSDTAQTIRREDA